VWAAYQILHAQERRVFQLASSSSITQSPRILNIALYPLVHLIDQIIEHPNGGGLREYQFDQMFSSPRELVRIFHRRCGCSCLNFSLKDLYYNLKGNTSKMTRCNGCRTANKLVGVKVSTLTMTLMGT
jgi:hypothetical protein